MVTANHLCSSLNDFIVFMILYIAVICVFTKTAWMKNGMDDGSSKFQERVGGPGDFYISNYCGRLVDYQKPNWTNLNTTCHD